MYKRLNLYTCVLRMRIILAPCDSRMRTTSSKLAVDFSQLEHSCVQIILTSIISFIHTQLINQLLPEKLNAHTIITMSNNYH